MKNLILILLLCPILMWGQRNSHKDITGVWRATAVSWNTDTKQYADCEIIKFITKTRWATIFYWPQSNEMAGTGGGTYQWVDDTYVETLEYFTWDTSAVGTTQVFSMQVENGKLIQEGKLKTKSFQYPYYAVHQRMDKLSWAYENQEVPQGVWEMVEASYGDDVYDSAAIQEKYGQVVKIITPKYFIGTFFDSQKRTVAGVTFGSYIIDDAGKYQETIKCWTWGDPSMIGKQPSFDWAIDGQGKFHQNGVLNSEKYLNYALDEHYVRLEPLDREQKM